MEHNPQIEIVDPHTIAPEHEDMPIVEAPELQPDQADVFVQEDDAAERVLI